MAKNALITFSALAAAAAGLLSGNTGNAQNIALDDLKAFRAPSPNWRIAGGVIADFTQKDHMTTTSGSGILANIPSDHKSAKDILTVAEHGDADIEMEFMMARGSNSGVYLQGRYEIQLLDSWGKRNPAAGDCGGIYERWDDARPEGKKGYEGYAPRLNASRAPGVWQKLAISFQAPHFDASGRKIANARIIRIQLNGLTIHENVELTGPTRGGMNNDEAARGPLRIQGDHGPVAIRSLVIKSFDSARPKFKDLRYQVFEGRVSKPEQLQNLKALKEGQSEHIDHRVNNLTNDFVLRFSGKIVVPEAGNYRFAGRYGGGFGQLAVNNQPVLPFSWGGGAGEVTLPKGEVPIEYTYSKVNEGDKASMALTVEGPGFRATELHDPGSVVAGRSADPIFLEPARETVIHRSFIDFNRLRLPYWVSVGDLSGLNYSMNLATGALLRTWRGDFLNVTPMWNDRGNGTSVPLGSVLNLSETPQVTEVAGSKAEKFTFKGYQVNANNDPTFLYEWNGIGFEDVIQPDPEKKYLTRSVKTGKSGTAFTFDLAQGERIDQLAKDTFLVNGSYFIKVPAGNSPVITDKNGKKVLTVQAKDSLSYSLIW